MSSYVPCVSPCTGDPTERCPGSEGNPGTAHVFTTRQIPSGSALLSAGFGVGPAVIR
jgi:hypothetical protein